MANRLDLQTFFENILGSRNVYFQPPSSVRMHYPAIRYSLDMFDTKHANDAIYLSKRRYSVTYITDDPDDPMVDELTLLPLCRFVRSYVADNLNHYTYELYY